MIECEEITTCIACGGSHLTPLLDLGKQPLANSYLKNKDDPEKKYPLAVRKCEDCFHVQLTHKVDPDLLFKEYLYVSGTAPSQLKYFDWFAGFSMEYFRAADMCETVLDIGCNDGSQLNSYQTRGLTTYGVDPAENLYELSSRGHNVRCGYFNESTFPKLQFDIITCQNAFAHNYDQLQLLKNIKRVMNPWSVLFITTSQANMIVNGEFDTIYHEHLSFYNIKSMSKLCERAGLNLIDVVKHPIHGTSYIFVIGLARQANYRLANLIEEERSRGLYDSEPTEEQRFLGHRPTMYSEFRELAAHNAKQFRDYIDIMRKNRTAVVGYGAPAKGNVFMNYAGIGPDVIIDDNPLKVGLYTPGLAIPIVSSDELKKYKGNVVIIPMAWNFFDDIKKKVLDKRPAIDYNDTYVRILPKFEVSR